MQVIEFGVSPAPVEPTLYIFKSARWLLGRFLQRIEPASLEFENVASAASKDGFVKPDPAGRDPARINLVSPFLQPSTKLITLRRARIDGGKK
jgi:hypothetical protein